MTGTSAWVHLVGARSDVPRFLSSFDAFALPSTSEGLPLVLLEAMATGLPIVASAVDGIPDVVREGETGRLVPPADLDALRAGLVALDRDRVRARRLGERAREVALGRYSLETMTRAYMALYQQLLRGSRAPGVRPLA